MNQNNMSGRFIKRQRSADKDKDKMLANQAVNHACAEEQKEAHQFNEKKAKEAHDAKMHHNKPE